MRWSLSSLCALMLMMVASYSSAQGKEDSTNISKANYFSPLIYPGYSPELGFNVGAGILWSFSTKKNDVTLLRSSVPLTVTYGFKGAVSLKANWVTYWLNNKLRINSDWSYRDMNDQYFGVGYDNGKNTVQSDSTTAYNKNWFQFDTRAVYEIEKNLFIGIRLDLNQTIVTNPNPKMQEDPDYLNFGPDNYNSGIGLVIQHDSRDFPQNALEGTYLSVMLTNYSNIFGGKNEFAKIDIDIRKYISLSQEKQRILAIWLNSKLAGGDVPYNEMNQFGPNDLRGYYWGQYRDKAMIHLITEYRHKFHMQNGDPSKFGMVLFAGSGGMNEEFGKAILKNILPNGGFGLRYELQPRLNIRFDYGIGLNSHLIYFGFAEHF